MKWEKSIEDKEYLIFKTEAAADDIYTLFFDKKRLLCDFYREHFICNENMFIPQQQETNPNIKWSSKYGHWQKEHPEIDLKTAELIVKILDTLTEHQEEQK